MCLLSFDRLYNHYPNKLGDLLKDAFRVTPDGKSPSIGHALKKLRKDVMGFQGLKDLWRLYRM